MLSDVDGLVQPSRQAVSQAVTLNGLMVKVGGSSSSFRSDVSSLFRLLWLHLKHRPSRDLV